MTKNLKAFFIFLFLLMMMIYLPVAGIGQSFHYLPIISNQIDLLPSTIKKIGNFEEFVVDYQIFDDNHYILTLQKLYQNGELLLDYSDEIQGDVPDDLFTDETGFQSILQINQELFLFFTEEKETFREQSVFVYDLQATDIKGSERLFIRYWSHKNASHLGGMLYFENGYLFLSTGDGAPQGDPEAYAQNYTLPLGALLRFQYPTTELNGDCAALETETGYTAAGTYSECNAVLAKGLRHVWRYSTAGDVMYLNDVGKSSFESIYAIDPLGSEPLNMGWPCVEGTTPSEEHKDELYCLGKTFTDPIYTYEHTENKCAIINAFSYAGYMVIVDFCGAIFYIDSSGNIIQEMDYGIDWSSAILSDNILYLVSFNGLERPYDSDIYTLELAK